MVSFSAEGYSSRSVDTDILNDAIRVANNVIDPTIPVLLRTKSCRHKTRNI